MNRSQGRVILELILIEAVFFAFWYFMYGSFLVNHVFLFGDVGLPYFNQSPIIDLFSFSPNLSDALFILVYNVNAGLFPMFFNSYLFFVPFLVPLGIYYLTYSMGLNGNVRIISTLFYSMNPLMLMFSISGLEYVGIFFFFPLILAFQIKYYKNKQREEIVASFLLMFLMFIFLGYAYIKFTIFIFIGMSIIDLFFAGRHNLLHNIKNYFYGLTIFLILSLPIIDQAFGDFGVYSSAAVVNSSTLGNLVGIAKFEFANSNILTSLYALPYVSNQLTAIGYESSWFGLLYLFMIVFGIIYVIIYKGEYKRVNYVLFLVLLFLILFQYGVYNGTLINLYYDYFFLDIYNYPLFFYISQILIYSVFISIGLTSLLQHIKNKDFKIKSKHVSKPLAYTISAFFIVLIMVSSLPIINYEHYNNPTTCASNKVPGYVFELTKEIKPYSNSRVLILPDNGTSLGYIDTGVSLYDVYGLPYGYQNFLSLFPNSLNYSKLEVAFQQNDIKSISKILETESINAIVVLNPLSNQAISLQGTSINGGGKIFDALLNKTGLYQNIVFNNNYAIYKFNVSSSIVNINPNYFKYYGNLTYHAAINNLTTSVLSYNEYPVNITSKTINTSGYFDYKIEVNRYALVDINSNFSNLLFTYKNGTIIPAWIKNIYNGTATIYLKLVGEIDRTIYLRIYPVSSNEMLTGYLGEAPQLSGEGTAVLPKYIIYSSIVVGVYGYGYDGSIYTFNFTFNTSYFSNTLNQNLSNLAFFTYNGSLLQAHLDSVSNDHATVTISFPGGVNYFTLDRSIGNSYNIFYMGFAKKNSNLNALNNLIRYNMSSQNTEIDIGYIPYAVRDFGIYNEYDNGKMVFPYFNSFIGGYTYSNVWVFGVPVSGYGLFSDGVYPSASYYVNNLYNLTPEQTATTYSYIYGGNMSSPLYVSNTTDSALFGNLPTNYVIGGGLNQSLQQHSTDIGFGVTATNASLFLNYNKTDKYVYKTLESLYVSGFNNYSIYYNTGLSFSLNGKNVGRYGYNIGSLRMAMSNVYDGKMISLYSYVSNNVSFNYTIGKGITYQAYLDNSKLQNPSYTNSTVTFTYFGMNSLSSTVKWKINNITFYGNPFNYIFSSPGNYSLSITYENKTYRENEIIAYPPVSQSEKISLNSTGNHVISTKNSGGIYEWYVNGIIINRTGSTLTYNFRYYETYGIRVFVLTSMGNYSYSFIVNVHHVDKVNSFNYLYILYNSILPLGIMVYITSGKFRIFLKGKGAYVIRTIREKIYKEV